MCIEVLVPLVYRGVLGGVSTAKFVYLDRYRFRSFKTKDGGSDSGKPDGLLSRQAGCDVFCLTRARSDDYLLL